MTFRRRRRINWVSVISLIIGVIGIGSLIIPRISLPKTFNRLSFFPQPTPSATPTIDDGAAALTKANALFDDGKLDQAVDQYALVAAIAERAQADFSYIADKLDAAGNTEEAAARRTDAQNAILRAGSAYTRACNILAMRQKTDDAIARCNRAIEINNRSAEAYAYLALAYDRADDYDKAIAAAQRAVDLDPTLAEGYAFLAEAYADKSPFEKRNMQTALKAVEVNNKSAFAHRNLGWVYETEGNYQQAALSHKRATELMPNLSYFYIDLCRARKVLGQTAEATTACQKATELDPQNAETYDRLGQLYYDTFDNQKALVQFQKATEVDPSYASAYAHLGWVYYFRMYTWEKAAAAFEKALELGTNKMRPSLVAELQTELGWSYYRLGRCADARPMFDRALGLLSKFSGSSAATISQQANEGIKACEGKK